MGKVLRAIGLADEYGISDLGAVVCALTTVALLFVGIFVAANAYSRYQCESYAAITDRETRYNNWDVCYIKTAQGWQRWDEYKARAIASEGLSK